MERDRYHALMNEAYQRSLKNSAEGTRRSLIGEDHSYATTGEEFKLPSFEATVNRLVPRARSGISVNTLDLGCGRGTAIENLRALDIHAFGITAFNYNGSEQPSYILLFTEFAKN